MLNYVKERDLSYSNKISIPQQFRQVSEMRNNLLVFVYAEIESEYN
jgi:hypothetical protein